MNGETRASRESRQLVNRRKCVPHFGLLGSCLDSQVPPGGLVVADSLMNVIKNFGIKKMSADE